MTYPCGECHLQPGETCDICIEPAPKEVSPKRRWFITRYRIVRDAYAGYEAQFKPWWWPFWMQCFGMNTHFTVQSARECCFKHDSSRPVPVKTEVVDSDPLNTDGRPLS